MQSKSTYHFESAISAFADSKGTAIALGCLRVLRRIAENVPLVIFLDDLQWSDLASIDLLYYLGAKLRGTPIMLIGVFRSSDIATIKPTLVNSINELKMRISEFVHIDLDKEDGQFVTQFVSYNYPQNQFTSKFLAQMQAHTGGNPLFVSELFQYLVETNKIGQNGKGVWRIEGRFEFQDLPPKVETVIERRIASLEAGLRKILEIASVEGEEFTAQVIANLRGIEERQIIEQLSDELERKWHLIGEARSIAYQQKRLHIYRFKHALIQMYLYGHLSPIERELLHRDIGMFLEGMYDTDIVEKAPSLAEHFKKANMPEKEARYRFLAAQKAADMGARETAIYHLNFLETILNESSISKTENASLPKKLYGLRGNLYALIPVPEKARGDFRQLEVLAKADNDTCTMARALCGYGIIERSLGNFDSALSYVSQVEEIAPEECTDVMADCKLLAAKTYKDKGQYEQADKWAAMAQSLYEQLGKRSGILDARSQIAYGYYARGQYDEAKEIWMENLLKAPQLANLPPDPDDDVYFCLGFLHWRLGEHDKAKDFFSTALEAALQMDNQRKQAYCLNDLCFVETSLGNYDKAESNAREALSIFQVFGDKKGQAWANGNLGNALAHAGKLEDAVKFLDKARFIEKEIGLKSAMAENSRRLSLIYLRLSDLSEAYRYAQYALEEAEVIGRQAFVGMAYRALGEIAAEAKFKPDVNLIDIQDPETYFNLSVKIAQETRNKSEEAQSLRVWGEYLIKLPDSTNNEKGKDLLQRASILQ